MKRAILYLALVLVVLPAAAQPVRALRIFNLELKNILHDGGVMIIFVVAGFLYPILYNFVYRNGILEETPTFGIYADMSSFLYYKNLLMGSEFVMLHEINSIKINRLSLDGLTDAAGARLDIVAPQLRALCFQGAVYFFLACASVYVENFALQRRDARSSRASRVDCLSTLILSESTFSPF